MFLRMGSGGTDGTCTRFLCRDRAVSRLLRPRPHEGFDESGRALIPCSWYSSWIFRHETPAPVHRAFNVSEGFHLNLGCASQTEAPTTRGGTTRHFVGWLSVTFRSDWTRPVSGARYVQPRTRGSTHASELVEWCSVGESNPPTSGFADRRSIR